jgi:hypothetical protein
MSLSSLLNNFSSYFQVLAPCEIEVQCYFRFFIFYFEGSLVLVGGDPGVGKSTLLLQVYIFWIRFCYEHCGHTYDLSFTKLPRVLTFLQLLVSLVFLSINNSDIISYF